jgi:hypothetical protein
VTNLSQHLARGEALQWSGRPRQGIVLRASDAFMIPFSILWAGFAFFWEASVLRGGAPLFFGLWGIPFVLVGLYATIGRFFYDAARRASTEYGVTNQRIIIDRGPRGALTSLELPTLGEVTVASSRDGSGTITFGPSNVMATMYAGTPWPGLKLPPSFDLIPEAKRVYEIIRQARSREIAQRAI